MNTDDEDNINENKQVNNEPGTYSVGYGRPPVHTQFQPGESGNRKGRPRGRRNLKTDLEEELSERITVRDGDRPLRMTKQRALVKSTLVQAIKGDPRAQSKAFELLLRAFGFDDDVRGAAALEEKDSEIIAAFFKRTKERNHG